MLDGRLRALWRRSRWCRILRQTLQGGGQGGRVPSVGTNERLSAPHAALANGHAGGRASSWTDVQRAGVPARRRGGCCRPLIAVAETRPPFSGRDFLAAAAAGYENRPASAFAWVRAHRQGWHSGATVGYSRRCRCRAGFGIYLQRKPSMPLGIGGTQWRGLMAGNTRDGEGICTPGAPRKAASMARCSPSSSPGIENVFEAEYGRLLHHFSRSQDPLPAAVN